MERAEEREEEEALEIKFTARACVHVGAFKIGGIVCSLSHALRSAVEAMEITRAESARAAFSKGSILLHARYRVSTVRKAAETSPRKNCEKDERAGEGGGGEGEREQANEQLPMSHMMFQSSDTFCAPWLPISLLLSLFPILLCVCVCVLSRYPLSFSISGNGGGRLHSRRMANWTRNFILPDERPPRPER